MNSSSEKKLTIPETLPPGLRNFCNNFNRLVGLGLVSGHIMHDIRNSLAVVSGHAQLIQLRGDKASHDDILKRMEQIIEQVDKILSNINRVGSYTQRAKGEKSEISLDRSLENAVHSLERRFENAGIQVNLHIPEISKNIWCDGSLCDFVILQLLEILIPEEYTDGRLTLESDSNDSWWEANIWLIIKADKGDSRQSFIEKCHGFELVAVLYALEKLKGELYHLDDADGYGFRLHIPYKVDGGGIIY